MSFHHTVTSLPDYDCQTEVKLSNQEGVISSHAHRDAGCGSNKPPWIISGLPGQRIKLSIIDFGSEVMESTNKTQSPSLYGYIQDGAVRKKFYADVERERFLYESKTNRVTIELEYAENSPGFLLKYQSKLM